MTRQRVADCGLSTGGCTSLAGSFVQDLDQSSTVGTVRTVGGPSSVGASVGSGVDVGVGGILVAIPVLVAVGVGVDGESGPR